MPFLETTELFASPEWPKGHWCFRAIIHFRASSLSLIALQRPNPGVQRLHLEPDPRRNRQNRHSPRAMLSSVSGGYRTLTRRKNTALHLTTLAVPRNPATDQPCDEPGESRLFFEIGRDLARSRELIYGIRGRDRRTGQHWRAGGALGTEKFEKADIPVAHRSGQSNSGRDLSSIAGTGRTGGQYR